MTVAGRSVRSKLWLVAAIGLLAVACSVEDTLSPPNCVGNGSGLIAAQSVPDAELVPCLGPLPEGWDIDSVVIDQSGTTVRFDSDRAGIGAARLDFASECDVDEAAVWVRSDQDGADRFDFTERLEPGFRSRWYYLFPGGCVWWTFDFDDETSASLSIEVGDRLTLLTRESVNNNVSESFIDEEL